MYVPVSVYDGFPLFLFEGHEHGVRQYLLEYVCAAAQSGQLNLLPRLQKVQIQVSYTYIT